MHDQDVVLRRIVADHGVFLRREAVAQGLDDKSIRRAVRSGAWIRVRHGAYVFADQWARATDREKLVLLTRAVIRVQLGAVAASHHSASSLHGLDLWDVDFKTAHVTRLDGEPGRKDAESVHHEGLCLDADIVSVEGLHVVRPVRAALESAALAGVERGLVVVDSGLHKKLFTVDDLVEQHDLMKRWPGTQHLQLVTRLADGRSASAGESRSKFLFFAEGIPMPQLQFEVYDGAQLVGVTDFAWPEHRLLGEFDGRVKYGRFLKPGEAPGDAVFREKRREDLLRRLTGWSMVRITWDDLHHPARTAALVRSMMSLAA